MRGPRPLVIAGVEFSSRLLVGTGKFSSPQAMAAALDASGAEIVTVALRRVDVGAGPDATLAALDPKRHRLLPNTSGARDAVEAVRLAKLGRAACGTECVKLEVVPDPRYRLPDPVETLKAAEDIGIAKPDARLFHEALSRGGVKAGAAVHVGDHPGDDIAGAQQAGLRAVWFNPGGNIWQGDTRPDAEIGCLSELPQVLKHFG